MATAEKEITYARVRVKPGQTGYDGHGLRKEGDVFLLDVRKMEKEGAVGTSDYERMVIGKKTYMLPTWLEDAALPASTADDEPPPGLVEDRLRSASAAKNAGDVL